jgi:hypothetical protein
VVASARASSWWLVLGTVLLTSVALGAVPIVARPRPAASEEPLG